MVEAVLLCSSSKCGETEDILEWQKKVVLEGCGPPVGEGGREGGSLLGFWDHDGLQQLVQLVLHQVGQLAHSTLVPLNHVQVQLELFGDGRVGRVALGLLPGLAAGGQPWTPTDYRGDPLPQTSITNAQEENIDGFGQEVRGQGPSP